VLEHEIDAATRQRSRKVDRLRLDRRLPSEAFPLRQGEDALATITVDQDGKAADWIRRDLDAVLAPWLTRKRGRPLNTPQRRTSR